MDETKEGKLDHLLHAQNCLQTTEDTLLEALCDVSTESRYHALCRRFNGVLGWADTAGWDVLKILRCAFLDLKAKQKYDVLLNSHTLQSAVNLGSLQVIEYLVEKLTEAQILNLIEKKDYYGRSAFSVASEAPFEVLHTLLAFVPWKEKTALITREFSPPHCYNYICRLNGLWRNQADMIGKRISPVDLANANTKVGALHLQCQRQAADVNSLKDELKNQKTQQQREKAQSALETKRCKADVNSLRDELENQKMQQQREKARLTKDLAEANTKVGALDLQFQRQAAGINSLKDELKNQKTEQQREKAQSALETRRHKADISSLKDELKDQKMQQQREKVKLTKELESYKEKTETLEVIGAIQASNIDLLKAELYNQKSQQAELRRENNELVEETRRQAVKQERMERMMEEMERLLRQPICIGPEMDQEHEE